jgi:hypothetical protein
METGHLNIPKLELDRVAFVHDIQTRLYLLYSKLIENEDIGTQVLAMLGDDPRVQALDGKMISRGSGAVRFELKTLAMWFLWAVNEYGQDAAEKNLNTFLDSEQIPVVNTLWVLGIEVDRTLELEHDYRIVPIKEMPDSRDKEQYLRHGISAFVHGTPMPEAAITCTCHVTKITGSDDPAQEIEKDKAFWDSTRYLGEIALLLNALDGVSCIPYFSTSYALPDMPIGMFGGSGGGAPLYDIFGDNFVKLSEDVKSDLNGLLAAFAKFTPNEKARISRILSRLSQAKRRNQIEDKILDLGIALEMAILEDNKNIDQLSLSFRLRGSWLIGREKEDRQDIFRKLKDIYNYRSQVAHSGILCGNDPEQMNAVRERFQEYCLLAEKIVRHLILNGRPDWTRLILGVI